IFGLAGSGAWVTECGCVCTKFYRELVPVQDLFSREFILLGPRESVPKLLPTVVCLTPLDTHKVLSLRIWNLFLSCNRCSSDIWTMLADVVSNLSTQP